MSDISIPGVSGSSNLNTDKIIEELMKVERIPLDRKEESLNAISQQKRVWQDVNRQLSRLRDTSKKLFGFENPFNERVATAADSSSFTAGSPLDLKTASADDGHLL